MKASVYQTFPTVSTAGRTPVSQVLKAGHMKLGEFFIDFPKKSYHISNYSGLIQPKNRYTVHSGFIIPLIILFS